MQCHFNPADPNARVATHKPGVVYMQECMRALAGAGTYSPQLLEVARNLINAKPTDDQGWALRGMVANQQALFSPLSDGLLFSVDWLTNEGAKLDKTYDTFKGLLSDDWTGGYIKAKFGWLNPLGISLSFGIQGILAGAAAQLLTNAFKPAVLAAAETAGTNASAAIQVARVGVQAAQDAAIKRTEAALTVLDSAEGKLAAKIQTWCHHQCLALNAILEKKPPPRPVRARAELDVLQALEVTTRLQAQGETLNRTTRRQLELWKRLPAEVRSQRVKLDFLTTDVDIKNMPTVEALGEQATHVRLSVLSDVAGIPRLIEVDTQSLSNLYQRAHRYDALKRAAVNAVGVDLPIHAAYVGSAILAPARAVVQGAQAAVAPNGVLQQAAKAVAVAGAKAAGAVATKGNLSIFGAYLQWHLYEANRAKFDKLARAWSRCRGSRRSNGRRSKTPSR